MREQSWLSRHPILHRLVSAAVILFCLMAVVSGLLQWASGDHAENEGFSYVRTPASEFPSGVDLEKLRSEVDWPTVQAALR